MIPENPEYIYIGYCGERDEPPDTCGDRELRGSEYFCIYEEKPCNVIRRRLVEITLDEEPPENYVAVCRWTRNDCWASPPFPETCVEREFVEEWGDYVCDDGQPCDAQRFRIGGVE